MHHTRRTDNAHNKTQRRIKKLSKKAWGYYITRYNNYHYDGKGDLSYIEFCWDIRGLFFTLVKTHYNCYNFSCSHLAEELKKIKKHSFYVRCFKSNMMCWKWKKRKLHKIWRIKSFDELTYFNKDAVRCSLYDLW